ncbi:hypothetical protein AB4Y87_04990 [Paenarthrobacter sp. RAF54_2]
MTENDEFLAWVRTTLYQAEVALLNGDSAPRRAIWSSHEPVSVLGAWRNAVGQEEVGRLFTDLATGSPTAPPTHSNCRPTTSLATWPTPLVWSDPQSRSPGSRRARS